MTNPDNLFDAEKGIYVTGNQFIEWKNSENLILKKTFGIKIINPIIL